MYFGYPTLCLNVKDLAASTRFYQAMGMQPIESASGERYAVLQLGAFRLGLFEGVIPENSLNLRGADVFEVHRRMSTQLPELEGEPERYSAEQYDATADGACWMTHDPDGNGIFFDTNETEMGESFKQKRIADILRDAERELVDMDANPECIDALRTHVIEKHCDPA